MKILLAEDEPSLASVIQRSLTENGYEVSIAPDGAMALDLARQFSFDAMIFDVMLPQINGIQLCKQIRQENIHTPVLFLTALGTTENVVAGLDAGGDDYLTKPFTFPELNARLRAITRRKQTGTNASPLFTVGNISIDFSAKTVKVNQETVLLTPTEFRLLEFFVRNPNTVLSRVQILEHVWGIDFNLGTNVVDVYVNYLRKKLSREEGNKIIQTVVGMGYLFKTGA